MEYEQGSNSGLTYTIGYGNTKYILKTGVREISSIIETSNFIREYHPELESSGKIILPLIAGEFNGWLYEPLPVANGTSFKKLFYQYVNKEIDASQLEKCFFSLGETLYAIHSKEMVNNQPLTSLSQLKTRLIHKDTHSNNMLCNIDQNGNDTKVSLIDNQKFLFSIKEPATVYDDLYIIFQHHATLVSIHAMDFTTIEELQVIKDYIKIASSFLKGYVSNLKDIDHAEYMASIFLDRVSYIYSCRFELKDIFNESLPGVNLNKMLNDTFYYEELLSNCYDKVNNINLNQLDNQSPKFNNEEITSEIIGNTTISSEIADDLI